MNQKISDIQSPKANHSIVNSMRVARYRDPKILQTACFVFKMLTSFDHESPPHVSTLYDVSELMQVLSFFNQPKYDLYENFVKQMDLAIQNVD